MKIPEKRKTVYFNFAKKNKIRTLIAPSISEADEHGNFHQWVRPIKIEDLLGRPEISINIQEVAAEFRDKIIMVTGLCFRKQTIVLIINSFGPDSLHKKIACIFPLSLLLSTKRWRDDGFR